MIPHYEDSAVRLYCGDALSILRGLPAPSVQCVITSPPYWGLRDYGTAAWEGGEVGCDHAPRAQLPTGVEGGQPASLRDKPSRSCKCGARRLDAQLGLEKTPDEYVANLVGVFREVWRVLREDGTLWLNLGDSYAANRSYQVTDSKHVDVGNNGASTVPPGLKPKDLVGIPWRVALALQADGWYLRSDIIWAKPNPMPESVTDRPTKAHEYLFLLAKSQRYYYDAEAIKEPSTGQNGAAANFARTTKDHLIPGQTAIQPRLDRDVTTDNGFRNRRTVWEIATQPYPGAHFATFPVDLVKPCVLAGAPVGGMVLDPFAGSGTTCYVAKDLGRRAIGIDLNAAYLDLAVARLRQDVLAL